MLLPECSIVEMECLRLEPATEAWQTRWVIGEFVSMQQIQTRVVPTSPTSLLRKRWIIANQLRSSLAFHRRMPALNQTSFAVYQYGNSFISDL